MCVFLHPLSQILSRILRHCTRNGLTFWNEGMALVVGVTVRICSGDNGEDYGDPGFQSHFLWAALKDEPAFYFFRVRVLLGLLNA